MALIFGSLAGPRTPPVPGQGTSLCSELELPSRSISMGSSDGMKRRGVDHATGPWMDAMR